MYSLKSINKSRNISEIDFYRALHVYVYQWLFCMIDKLHEV